MEENRSITIIGVNYYPENTAIGLYTTQLAEYLDSRNINVNIICGFPYYPAWKIDDDYKNKRKYTKEVNGNITIYRYKQYVPSKPTFLKRIIHLMDFTLGSIINVIKIKKTDVVLCVVPFTSTIILGKLLSIRKKAKLWVHIQDFEFDAASETNLIGNNKLLFNILFSIEKRLLNSADLTSTISKSMFNKLRLKTKEGKSRTLLPNWVDVNNIYPEKYNTHTYLKSNKFKILYAGNIGEKQDWNFFLNFSRSLEGNENIEIVVVGDGSKKNWLLDQIKEQNVLNVKHFLPVPYEELSDLLCSADLHILFQKENVKDTVMPSKILAMMASERPSLITGNEDSEVASIIREAKAGRYLQSKETNEVKDYINNLVSKKRESVEYGKSAREYVSDNFSKQNILNKFYDTFDSLSNY